jgi:flagella basal body P-ring formation protein FlgA
MAADGIEIQSRASILSSAETYLQTTVQDQHSGRIKVTMGNLDPRLRLTRCAQGLQVFQPSGARNSGRTSVGVRCPDASGWTIYVPAEISVFAKALVATRPLARGAGLTPGDVTLVETDVSKLGHGYLETPADIDGLVTRRPVAAGTVLTSAMIKAPLLVKRGDRVRLVSGEGPIQVEMLGEAIEAAARGDRVRVRALDSKRVVEGWVVSASVVKMTL